MPSAPIDEVQQYLVTTQKRIDSGCEYCLSHPNDTVALNLLHELDYRRRWATRLLSHLQNLENDATFGYEVDVVSPAARFVNILAVMLGSRSGVEDNNFLGNLAAFAATNNSLKAVEEKIAAFDEGYSLSPEELRTTISEIAISGFRVWLEFRKQLTNF